MTYEYNYAQVHLFAQTRTVETIVVMGQYCLTFTLSSSYQILYTDPVFLGPKGQRSRTRCVIMYCAPLSVCLVLASQDTHFCIVFVHLYQAHSN